jgi:hypothetical protein
LSDIKSNGNQNSDSNSSHQSQKNYDEDDESNTSDLKEYASMYSSNHNGDVNGSHVGIDSYLASNMNSQDMEHD